MTHAELRELLPAYALNALGPIDRLEVRAHLDVCSTCDEVLRENLETAAALALTVPPEGPTDGLRQRLLGEVAGTAQVLPIGLRNGWRKLPRRVAPLAAAMVLLLGALGGVVTTRIASEDRFVPGVLSLLSSPNVNAVAMSPSGEDLDASGQLFVASDARAAAVIMTGLDDPGKDVYQLAVVLDGQTVPLRTFQPDKSGMAVVLIHKNLEAMEGVIVTRETASGLKAPGGRPILKSG